MEDKSTGSCKIEHWLLFINIIEQWNEINFFLWMEHIAIHNMNIEISYEWNWISIKKTCRLFSFEHKSTDHEILQTNTSMLGYKLR